MQTRSDEGGFVMIDAITGVMIIALTAAVVLTALSLSRHYRQRAEMDRGAAAAFSYLMATVPKMPGRREGRVVGFRYEAEVTHEALGSLTLCRVSLKLTHLQFNRSYRLSGLRPCLKRLP